MLCTVILFLCTSYLISLTHVPGSESAGVQRESRTPAAHRRSLLGEFNQGLTIDLASSLGVCVDVYVPRRRSFSLLAVDTALLLLLLRLVPTTGTADRLQILSINEADRVPEGAGRGSLLKKTTRLGIKIKFLDYFYRSRLSRWFTPGQIRTRSGCRGIFRGREEVSRTNERPPSEDPPDVVQRCLRLRLDYENIFFDCFIFYFFNFFI